MNCNEACRLIPSYVKKELPDRELEEFLRHVEHCSDCMDELDTYYTVYQALDLLDDGGHQEYNFRRMLKDDISFSWRRLKRKRTAGVLCAVFLVLTELLLAAGVYTGYQIRRGEEEYLLIQRAMLYMNGVLPVVVGEGLPDEAVPGLEAGQPPTVSMKHLTGTVKKARPEAETEKSESES